MKPADIHNALSDKNMIVREMFISSFLTMLLASVAMLLGTLIDGILIGNFLTTNDMAAYGLIHPVTVLLLAVTGIFSSGSQIVCTKHMSLGESDDANRAFSLSFALLLIVSLSMMTLFLIFDTSIVSFLGAANELLPLGRDYFIGLTIGFPGVLLATMLAPFAQLEGRQSLAVSAVCAMVGINVAGDLINVFVFNGGIFGMGIATSLGSYGAFIILFVHFLFNKKGYRLTFRNIAWRKSLSIILPGLPTAGGRLFATFRTLFLNYILIAISNNIALAAYSARMNIGTFFASTGAASGMAALSLTGFFYGEEDRTMLKKMFKIVMIYSVLIATMIMIFLLLFSNQIIALYMNTDSETLALSARALRFCAISLPFYAINNILANYLQAIRRIIFTNVLLFCQNLGFCLLSAFIMIPYIGTDGVWACYIAGEVATTVLYIVIAAVYSERMRPGLRNLMMLPEDYGISDEDLIEGSIKNTDELKVAAIKTELFCLSRCPDKDKADKVVFAFEEMTKNILHHGFCDSKTNVIDFRIFKKDEDFVIRLRDDCPSFNPVAKLDDMNASNDTSHMGIRITETLAKDISYIKIMNMNNLIIVI